LNIFTKIKRELLKRPANKFSGLLFEACLEIESEQNERLKNEKAKYAFNRDPGFIVCRDGQRG